MSKIKGIKYIGPLFDNSGYAKACRNDIFALLSQGVPVTLQPISFEDSKPKLGKDGDLLNSLVNKEIDYNVVMVRTTPEFWGKYKESGKVMVNHTIWETTKLHPDWIPYINNNADKVLVATEWNVQVFKDSGVTIPIGCVPHCIDKTDDVDIAPYNVSNVDDDAYVFGFVSQWTERKDPLSLLKAYWYAFQNNEKVALVMKTYRSNYSEEEKSVIRSTIQRLKSMVVFDSFPKLYYISDMLTEDEMRGLFKRIDCYVSLDRGEGWGLSPFQAGAYGKPVIVTGFGGVTEYLKPDNSYLINHTLTPTHGMPWSRWYKSEQLWAQADVYHGAKLMQEVYYNQKEAKEKGLKLQAYIQDNFSYEVVGAKMLKEIEEIL